MLQAFWNPWLPVPNELLELLFLLLLQLLLLLVVLLLQLLLLLLDPTWVFQALLKPWLPEPKALPAAVDMVVVEPDILGCCVVELGEKFRRTFGM